MESYPFGTLNIIPNDLGNPIQGNQSDLLTSFLAKVNES